MSTTKANPYPNNALFFYMWKWRGRGRVKHLLLKVVHRALMTNVEKEICHMTNSNLCTICGCFEELLFHTIG